MSINLIVVCVFIIVFTAMLWIMNDKQAKRVRKTWSKLLQVLPVSQIIRAFKGENNCSLNEKEP